MTQIESLRAMSEVADQFVIACRTLVERLQPGGDIARLIDQFNEPQPNRHERRKTVKIARVRPVQDEEGDKK